MFSTSRQEVSRMRVDAATNTSSIAKAYWDTDVLIRVLRFARATFKTN